MKRPIFSMDSRMSSTRSLQVLGGRDSLAEHTLSQSAFESVFRYQIYRDTQKFLQASFQAHHLEEAGLCFRPEFH